jgi:anthranilate/para-aminobenzoate synthase component II
MTLLEKLLNPYDKNNYSKLFKELVKDGPLTLENAKKLHESGYDVERYLHDPEITKNYNWLEIIKNKDFYLPFYYDEIFFDEISDRVIYHNSYTKLSHKFKADTLDLLAKKSGVSIVKLIKSPFDLNIYSFEDWVYKHLMSKEILTELINDHEYLGSFFRALGKCSSFAIPTIVEKIENDQELVTTLRKIEKIQDYLQFKLNYDGKISSSIFARINKILFYNQELSQIVDSETGVTLLDVIFFFTEDNIADFMSYEQLKAISPLSINTKIFNFGNYKLIALLKSVVCNFEDGILKKLETDGASSAKKKLVSKIIKFSDEYIQGKLSDIESKLIEGEQITLDEISGSKLKNSLNFDLLFLAISTRNFKLARDLIESGFKFYEANEFGQSKLSIIAIGNGLGDENKLLEIIKFAHLKENFSLSDPIPETNDHPLDLILSNYYAPDPYFVSLSGGTLYKFQEIQNAKEENIDPHRISIAISHGHAFWSTGIFSATHYLQKQNPDVDFYLVTSQVIDQIGPGIFSIFDGWINPGGADSYPKKKEFSKLDWKASLDTEILFQNVLGNATIFRFPTFGICAGAQNLVLSQGGFIKPIEGYSFGQHDIIMQKNSPLTYLALNQQEREDFHRSGIMPSIKFKGDTAHHYVAAKNKIPNGFSLGAISEDNEAMGYCDASGINCATQFHPEHKASTVFNTPNQCDRQVQLLNGFIDLARINHKCKIGEGICPLEYMNVIKSELDYHYGFCPLAGHQSVNIEEQ